MQIEAIAKQIQWERSSKPCRVRLTVVQLSSWNRFLLLRSGGITTLRRQRSIFSGAVVRKLWRDLCHSVVALVRVHRPTLNHNHASNWFAHYFRGQPHTTQCTHVCHQTLFRRL